MAKSRPRRAIGRGDILEAAFVLYAEAGEGGFSVRKVAAKVGVDPMTVLHHFRSKNELMRHIADRALQSVVVAPPTQDWAGDLRSVARAYRELAHRHPRVFHLHFRYHATGAMDHESAEIVYRAMRSAGLTDSVAAALGLAFYAFVLGFALAEIEGLLRPIVEDDERELLALEGEQFSATRALIPAFKVLDPDHAFEAAITTFLTGLTTPHNAPALVISSDDAVTTERMQRLNRG